MDGHAFTLHACGGSWMWLLENTNCDSSVRITNGISNVA
ncbi:hypothetical protein GBAR_LOCUS1651 [Geodia barretti]|uniref:Uncharacterized protein n=1 Tax=Geodia barretti TaxID=519541 RepID=A0AA35QWU2_GEOBA|nr:hypothetical protein GBAR_LOCUS1651 [Geodia barretti]